ncbi:MAG: hypothetical protein A4E28_00066 [Methanocella sp. PtaU1.Bin125]|nr:MAG: hypothetical protein A4E28_00066 [Methanocella sp. PtaU1.Bin125]
MEIEYGDSFELVPVGKRENNRGVIESTKDPGRGIVERITNAIDAVLELEYEKHNGVPECKTPRQAAQAWLNIPSNGLYLLDAAKRRELSKMVNVTIDEGDDKNNKVVAVRDFGIGILPEKMENTILSLGESNKLQKMYVAGAYGQGGSSTYASCQFTLIASRAYISGEEPKAIGYSVVFYQDLPAEEYKHGRYVYIKVNNKMLEANLPLTEFSSGTLVRHYGFDLSSYIGALGPNSVYGLLQYAMFDTILPIMLIDIPHDYRRVIKGSRNALNGAVDDSGERGPKLSHNVPIFYVNLGDYGRIGIEYWVLEYSEKNPSRAYVDNKKPIILTNNGQSHAELSSTIIKNKAGYPYLINRLIIHLDCDNLSPVAKRKLFVSSREDIRQGDIYKIIEEELLKALTSDDKLKILNEEAQNLTLKQSDVESEKLIKNEVAKILKFYGYETYETVGGKPDGKEAEGTTQPTSGRHVKRTATSIQIQDPPTFIKILGKSPIEFYPGQRRYLRVITDAPSNYHDAEDPKKSRINPIIGEKLKLSGTTPLREGRMRIIVDALANASIGSTGEIKVEVSILGKESISDKIAYQIIEKPLASPDDKKISIPTIKLVPINNPDDPLWSDRDWPNDINAVASSSVLEPDKLIVYYSRVYPSFAKVLKEYEKKSTALARSYEMKYGVWLSVHSLLIEYNRKEADEDALSRLEVIEPEERCRLASVAAMVAQREMKYEEKYGVIATE